MFCITWECSWQMLFTRVIRKFHIHITLNNTMTLLWKVWLNSPMVIWFFVHCCHYCSSVGRYVEIGTTYIVYEIPINYMLYVLNLTVHNEIRSCQGLSAFKFLLEGAITDLKGSSFSCFIHLGYFYFFLHIEMDLSEIWVVHSYAVKQAKGTNPYN